MNWDDLKLLLAIGRAGSVSGAARELLVHRATVLRRFDQMEKRLGAQLCDRTPEGYRLTEAGADLFALAEKTEREILAAEARVSGEDDRVEGTVRVTAPETLITSIIAPRLAELRRRRPRLSLSLMATMNLMDLSRRDADIAIRVTVDPPETLVGRRFGRVAQALYAAPEIAAKWPDLSPLPIIGWGDATPDWPARFNIKTSEVAGSSAEVSVQIAMAQAGLGVVCVPCFTADAAEGLERLAPRTIETPHEIWLLTHPDLRRQARIDATMGFLAEVLAQARPRLAGKAAYPPISSTSIPSAAVAASELP